MKILARAASVGLATLRFALLMVPGLLLTADVAPANPLPFLANPLAPNDPSINANLKLWLTGSNVTTSGSTVTGWNDQSGLSHNAAAFNIGSPTTAMSVGTVTNNGHTFSAVNTGASGVQGAGGFNIPTGAGLSLASGVGSTYFLVLETSTTNANNSRLIATDPATGNPGAFDYRNVSEAANGTFGPYDGTGSPLLGTTAITTGQFLVAAIRFSSSASGNTDYAEFVNGVEQQFGVAANLAAVNAFDIAYNTASQGGGNPIFKGDLAQVLIYNAPLTDAQVLGITQSIGYQDGVFVPEPSTFVLGAIGVGLLLVVKRRRRAG